MQKITELWVTDKSGKKYWKTTCSAEYSAPEFRNLQRHIDAAKSGDPHYAFMDADSARIESEDRTI